MHPGVIRHRPSVTDRLLATRERAGGDPEKHARYHRLVTRYQKWVLRDHIARRSVTMMAEHGKTPWK
jgi:hypothetical protein